ncbi:aldose 1-epimerase [Paenibacillus physcomitrellae]|uniref:Aldose 1-epimerase n=1 Tax=Paenibacillus physcomitrellae TaxID=1619311 RepID=A0ABQ1G456_9BACL|nr:aldose 1-epimerase [Paenibacillus physcomitrellae]GGA35127.1 aldose 1-epimerase [Paenibacillus physcomitrellae]
MKKVTKGQWNGYDTYILHSHELEVTLLPRLGNNIIGVRDLVQQREVLRRPEESELDFYLQKPYHFGIPLLIPPGRIRRGRFSYAGQTYQFDQNTANDNHIHGLHRTQSWCVSDIEEDEDGCSVTTEFITTDDPNWMRQYPVPLKLEMTLRLQGASLTQTFRITNLGEHAAPFGLGLHTWFLIDGEPDNWDLKLPVSKLYMTDEEIITTGETAPLGELEALNDKLNLKGTNFDTPLQIGGKPAEALLMRKDGYGLKYSADPAYFKHWVLYTKGEADQFLCIEPYTWLPDAPNLDIPHEESGLIEIKPEEKLELQLNLQMIYPS